MADRQQKRLELVERVFRLHKAGNRTRAIAKEVGKSERRVRQILSLMPDKVRYGKAS